MGVSKVSRTLLRDLNPNAIISKRRFVTIEALEAILRGVVVVIAVHGGILLMTKDDTRTRHTFTVGLSTLPTLWNKPLVTFQLCPNTLA